MRSTRTTKGGAERHLVQSIHDELVKINERLTSLEKTACSKLVDSEIQTKKAGFENDEIAIINYVKANPGRSKNKIIEVFEKGGYNGTTRSRKVTLEIINELKEYGVLRFQPDQKHQQRHCVYINNDSFLLNIKKVLDEFEEAMIGAVRTTPLAEQQLLKMTKENNVDLSVFAANYFLAVLTSYQHFVSMIMLQALIDWPNITKANPNTLTRAYQLLFIKLNEIQQALNDSLSRTDLDFRANGILTSWMMRPEIMLHGYSAAIKLGISPQLKKLYNAAWSVSKDDFLLVRILFTPNSLLKVEYKGSQRTERQLSFDDQPQDWERALKPWIEIWNKGGSIDNEVIPFVPRLHLKHNQ